MSLHDLVHDGKTESGAAFELRLERLENFVYDLWVNAGAGIGKANVPVWSGHIDGDSQRSAFLHGADSVFAEVPEYLFNLIAIGQGLSLGNRKIPFDANTCISASSLCYKQGKSISNSGRRSTSASLYCLFRE